jgi:uncharacterized protein YndB with AHSA1/START domain
MPHVYRRHALIQAPADAVWAVVADPMTHSDWWPEIKAVRMADQPAEGSHYTQKAAGPLWMTRWLGALLDALPEAVTKSSSSSRS